MDLIILWSSFIISIIFKLDEYKLQHFILFLLYGVKLIFKSNISLYIIINLIIILIRKLLLFIGKIEIKWNI